jgi:hypothetical protein
LGIRSSRLTTTNIDRCRRSSPRIRRLLLHRHYFLLTRTIRGQISTLPK